jgi:hypothetical protein
MPKMQDDQVFIFRSYINSFWYLYSDALYFHEQAKGIDEKGGFDCVRLSRTALLLYILSMEGLINRSLKEFLPEQVRDFVLEREEKWLSRREREVDIT